MELIEWLRHYGPRAQRVVSVCTGAFLSAEVGLLTGWRATSHWLAVDQLPIFGVTLEHECVVTDGTPRSESSGIRSVARLGCRTGVRRSGGARLRAGRRLVP